MVGSKTPSPSWVAGMGKGNGVMNSSSAARDDRVLSGSRLATDNMLYGVLAALFLTCLRLYESRDDSASRRAAQQQCSPGASGLL